MADFDSSFRECGIIVFQTPTTAILEQEDGVRRHGIERSCRVESDLKMNVERH